jgi:3-oxoacyl-[acyl-carrier protein] reductase
MQNGAPSNASYATSKGGLLGLTEGVASAYRHRSVFAYLVVAGYVQTALTRALSGQTHEAIVNACPQRRPASASEVANVVLFLASGRAAALSGQSISATGGMFQVPA